MLEPPPCEPPLLPDEEDEDCEPPPGLGIEAPPPPLLPPEGMLGELLPPPELPPEEPLLPEEPPLDGDDGEDGMDEDDCCCGQPPIRNTQTAPMAVACAATTGRDLRER
jgi:hypothetical protein